LPTYRVQLNERSYHVAVEQTGKDNFKATIDNEAFEVQWLRNREISTWIIHSSNNVIRAQTKALPSDKLDIWLAGVPFPASVGATGTPGVRPPVAKKQSDGDIRALMPGRVTSILVKEGDAVEAGTPILILEAMKMQNEIVSPITGIVKSVQVQEGAAVKKDALVVVVE